MRRLGQMWEVRRSGGELCLEWSIPGFLDLPCGGFTSHESPHFSFSDGCWYMRVFPDWTSSGRVCLSLRRDDAGPSARTVIVSVGVRRTGGEVEWRREEEGREFEKDAACFWTDFCSRSDLSQQGLIPEGALTVTCEMKVTARGYEKALEDYAQLLASGEGSDVIVQVGDVEFHVHSAVLFARCPALSVSLRHESRERASSRIVVEDCEPDVFRDFLHYLYTGSVRSLTERNVFGLYRVADKYLADDLKRMCSEHIPNTLSVRTFSDTARLASRHGESDLLERAVAFATGNILSILRSVEWQNFNRECPTEANEVLIKALGPLCESQTSKH